MIDPADFSPFGPVKDGQSRVGPPGPQGDPVAKMFAALQPAAQSRSTISVTVGRTRIDLSREARASVTIDQIITDDGLRNDVDQKHGTKALTAVLKEADAHEVTLRLMPVPMSALSDMTSSQLREWYARHGFEPDGDKYMLRKPRTRCQP